MEAIVADNPKPIAEQTEAELRQILAEIDASQERIRLRRAETAVLRTQVQELKADSARLMSDIRATLSRVQQM